MPVDRNVYRRLAHLPEQLPRRAWLAFSARQVRRLQPMLDIGWPTSPAEVSELVETALSQVEAHCDGAKRPSLTRPRVEALLDRLRDLDDSAGYLMAFGVLRDTANLLAKCRSVRLDWHPPGVQGLYYLKLPWITGARHDDMVRLHLVRMSQDLDTLLDEAAACTWDDSTPIPASLFGPLWPFGEPAWLCEPWPDDAVYRGFLSLDGT